MESTVAKIWKRLCTKKSHQISIMIVGLDNSGKTSILNKLVSLDSDNNRYAQSHSQHQQTLKAATLSVSSDSPQPRESLQSCSTEIVPTAANIRATTTGIIRDGHQIDSGAGGSGSKITPTVGYNYESLKYNKSSTMIVLDFSGHTRYRNLWQEFYNAVDAIVFVIDSSDLIRLVVVRDEIETMVSNPYFNSLASQTTEQIPSMLPSSASITSAQKKITIKQGKLIQSPLETNKRLGNQQNQHEEGDRSHAHQRRRTKVPILFLANKADLANSIDTEVIAKALNLNKLPSGRHPWSIHATSVSSSQGIVEGFNWLIGQLATND